MPVQLSLMSFHPSDCWLYSPVSFPGTWRNCPQRRYSSVSAESFPTLDRASTVPLAHERPGGPQMGKLYSLHLLSLFFLMSSWKVHVYCFLLTEPRVFLWPRTVRFSSGEHSRHLRPGGWLEPIAARLDAHSFLLPLLVWD